MGTRALLIATVATGLAVAGFSSQASADPVGGAIVGGAIGAAIRNSEHSVRSADSRLSVIRCTVLGLSTRCS